MESVIANRRDDLPLVDTSRGQKKVVLQVESLRKRYGSLEAVAGVSFNLYEGEIFGLLGLNGAGKTTLISMLATLRPPSEGDALLLGHSLRNEWKSIRPLIGVAPQEDALYPTLSAAENLGFFGSIYGVPRAELPLRITQLLSFVDLEDRRNDPVATFSGGMKRRLNLAAALVHDPEMILLDEPTSGVDPESREEILTLVRNLRSQGKSIIYTTHYMEEAEGLCDELAILEEGKFVATGTLDALLHSVDFSEIIELKGVSSEAEVGSITNLRGIGHADFNDGVLRLFVNRAVDYLEAVQKVANHDRSLRLKITPITLENLFLHLTGRKAHAGRKIYE
jgi:ABC-2 type transport system ATP-binding protein